MPTHAEQQAELDKIAAEINNNTDLWYKNDVGGVDVSGISVERQKELGIYRQPKEERDAFPDLVYRPISWKPAEIENDTELQNELARQDPKFRKQLNDARMEEVTIGFTTANPDYLSTKRNFSRMIKALEQELELPAKIFDEDEIMDKAYEAGKWTVEHLTSVFRALKKAGRLDVPPGEPKNLTQSELLSVLSDIRLGDTEAAISHYISFAMADDTAYYSDPRTFLQQHPALVARAVWYVWANTHPEISQDELNEFKKSMARHALPTVAMLEKSWHLRKESEYLNLSAAQRTALAPSSPQIEEPRELSQKELEALSDEEIEELRIKAMKEYRRNRYKEA